MSGRMMRRAPVRHAPLRAPLGSSIVVSLWLSGMAGQALAQPAVYPFDLPAEPLARALHDYAQISGRQIVFTEADVAGKTAPALKGRYSAQDALRRLLDQSGLEAQVTPTGGVMVRPKDKSSDPAPHGTGSMESVEITASRIVRNGFQAPTPTTVLGADEIQRAAAINIADQLNLLPQFAGSATPSSNTASIGGGTSGINALNLRGLGTQRTLILLDGHRLPASDAYNGSIDINNIPDALVKRVDIVTGGASAKWGSDAVAGVVNFVLDKDFTGLKGEAEGGVSTYGDDPGFRLSLTAGSAFAQGQGHFVLSAEDTYSAGITGLPRPWYRGTKTLLNPAYTPANGQPQYIVRDGAGYSTLAPGGIVQSGPLAGVYFGPNGTPAQLNYGSIVSNPFMVGGDSRYTDFGNGPQDLEPRLERQSVFAHVSYEVSDALSLYGEFSYNRAQSAIRSSPLFLLTGVSIAQDNAFLPPSVAASMAKLGLSSINIGTWNSDFGGIPVDTDRQLLRYLLGAAGKIHALGSDWTWEASANVNQSEYLNSVNSPIIANYQNAIDAVYGPKGSIVCRSTLTSPSNGCVPLNILGTGVASPAALSYVNGYDDVDATLTQDVASANLRGEPLSTWAGPLSLAAGIEYRRESIDSTSDPLGPQNAYYFGNYKPIQGAFDVTEGFVEAVTPLIKDASWGKSLDLDTAVRATRYSSSGYVTTWNIGATYAPVEDIKLRATDSQDIRAGNLNELYQPGVVAFGGVVDPLNKNQTYSVNQITTGNPSVRPEQAHDLDLGVVLQPRFLSHWSASVDYWDIRVDNAISSYSAQTIVSECYSGVSSLCPYITRNSAGMITQIIMKPINLAWQVVRGVDLEVDYRTALDSRAGGGALALRALATRYLEDLSNSGTGPSVSSLDMITPFGGQPTWRYLLEAVYDNGPLTLSVTGTGLSGGVANPTWIECSSSCPASTALNPTIDDNHVDGAFYVNAYLSYKVSRSLEAFLAVDDVANAAPPRVPPLPSFGSAQTGVNTLYYDVVGRMFRTGVRFEF